MTAIGLARLSALGAITLSFALRMSDVVIVSSTRLGL